MTAKLTLPPAQVESHLEWWRKRKRTSAWAERYGGKFNQVQQLLLDSEKALDDERRERAKQVRDRILRVRATIGGLTIAVLALLVLSSLAFNERNKANAALAVQRSEHLADFSAESGAGSVGALVAAEACAQAPAPRAAGALLLHLAQLDELVRVYTPAWTAGAFAERGKLLVLLSQTAARRSAPAVSTLTMLELPAQTITKRLVRTGALSVAGSASFLCGMRGARQFALAEPRKITIYTVAPDLRASASATRDVGPIDALACMPERNSVVLAGSDGTVETLDVATGAVRALERSPGSHFDAISISGNGRYVAALSKGMTFVDVFDTVRSSKIGHLQIGHPSCPGDTCGGEVVFSSDEKKLVWLDGTNIYIAALSNLDHATSYACAECLRANATFIWPRLSADDPLSQFPLILLPGRHEQYGGGIAYEGHPEYEIANPSGSLPFADYDPKPDGPRFVTDEGKGTAVEGNGIAVRSLRDLHYPLLQTSRSSASPSRKPCDANAERDMVKDAPCALSPDGRMLAFGKSEVQLYDVAAHVQIGALPVPPRLKSIEALRFDSSGLVVTATYESTDKRTQLAQYSVDPRDWQRHLCGLVKGSMTQLALLKVLKERNFDDQHGFTFQNACGLPSSRLSRN